MGADVDATTAEAIAEVAGRLDARELGEQMADHLIVAIPELAELRDADFRVSLRGSCTGNIAEILDGLATGRPPGDASPPPDATAWAHELAHRGVPLAALLRAYRIGHFMFQQVFEETAAALDLDPERQAEVLARASGYVFSYIDIVCTQLVDEYDAEREQWLRGAAAAQVELVQRLAAGEPVDPGEATATLRYDVGGRHLAFLVWRDPAVHRSSAPAVVARAVARELGGVQSLVVAVGEHAAWGWAAGQALRHPPGGRLPHLDRATSVALGEIHEGLAGMRRSHQEARAVREVGELVKHRGGTVVRYSSVALLALLLRDGDQARRFAHGELGVLAEDGDAALRLRSTLAVFLEEESSVAGTARRLDLHINTVKYRIKRAESLLGRPIGRRRVELEVALLLFDALDA